MKSIWKIFELLIIFVKWILVRFTNRVSDSTKCLVGKTAIVTGGNSGIGFAIVKLLASRGCKVIIADKMNADQSKAAIIEQTGNPNIIVKQMDLSSFESVRQFVADIRRTEEKLDILINNAGVGGCSEGISEDGLNKVMQINFYGSFLLTHLLIDLLKVPVSSRVIFSGSMLAFIHNLNKHTMNLLDNKSTVFQNLTIYCNSKLCNILAAQEFAKRTKKFGITVNSVDPGVSNTSIFNTFLNEVPTSLVASSIMNLILLFKTTESMAAQCAFHVASSEELETESGNHYFQCRPFMKPSICDNSNFCDVFWNKSEELVGLQDEEKLVPNS